MMGLCKLLDVTQPQTKALHICRVVLDAVEIVKDFFLLVLGNADTVVPNRHDYFVGHLLCTNPYLGIDRGVLQGIVDKVEENV